MGTDLYEETGQCNNKKLIVLRFAGFRPQASAPENRSDFAWIFCWCLLQVHVESFIKFVPSTKKYKKLENKKLWLFTYKSFKNENNKFCKIDVFLFHCREKTAMSGNENHFFSILEGMRFETYDTVIFIAGSRTQIIF